MVTIPLAPVDAVRITILMDNVTDPLIFPTPHVGAHDLAAPPRAAARGLGRHRDGLPDALIAQPGFSALVRVTTGGRERTILFDAGVTPTGVVENMRRLELSPGESRRSCSATVTGTTSRGWRESRRSSGEATFPCSSTPRSGGAGGSPSRASSRPSCRPPAAPHSRARASRSSRNEQPSFLLDGSVLVTGEVDRTTPFEIGFLGHEAHVHGSWEPDPLILDDQAIVMRLAGRGLVVLTGCGHAGIINVVRHAQRLTGETQRRRRDRRLPPQRADVRADHRADGRGLRRSPARAADAGPLHGLEGGAPPRARFPDAFVQSAVGTTISL